MQRPPAPTPTSFYDGPEILGAVVDALRAAGLDPSHLDIDDLAPLEDLNGFGRAATIALAELAHIQPGDRVIDVGAGLGAAAVFLAARHGARVVAVDSTPRFCAVADRLVRGTGLTKRVDVICLDALHLPFPDGTFDVVWSQLVSQSIADKARFLAELARVVRPDGRLALLELVAGPAGPIRLPTPWADRPDQSWLVSAHELKRLLAAENLNLHRWSAGQDAATAIRTARTSIPPARTFQLNGVQSNHEERLASLRANLVERRVELIHAVIAPRSH